MSVNRVIIVGNLGKDPETRSTTNGDPVANFSIATAEKFTNKAGQPQEKTEWHRCVAFKRQAEIIGQYAKKGSLVYVEGKIVYGEYEKEGVKRYTTDIMVQNFQFLGKKDDSPSGQSYESGKQDDRDFDDDIPFR